MTVPAERRCWCGGALGSAIGPYYRRCEECGAAVLAVLPAPTHFDVEDDEHDFYGRRYWTEYTRARALPDIAERVRSDLSERCCFWLERLLAVTEPPGRALEIGCGHGGFVRLLRELGFDAIGTELSGWVVDFARRTFDAPVLRGRLETLDLVPGFACIAAFDVLEHLPDPEATMRRCVELLAPDGVLLLQTPCYRGEGPDWSMFQEDEHIYLFTETSARRLLGRAGLGAVVIEPSLFPYDMWIVASRTDRSARSTGAAATTASWRLPAAFQGLFDLSRQLREVRAAVGVVDADRTARLAQVEELTRQVRAVEGDRAARLEQVHELTRLLHESEVDRAARLEQVHELTRLLHESEVDRAARLEQVHELTRLLHESEVDRAARFEVIQNLEKANQSLEKANQSLEKANQNLEKANQNLEKNVASLRDRLERIGRTTVWRLYGSLRSLTTGRRPEE